MTPLAKRRNEMASCAHCNNCKATPTIQSDRFALVCPSYDYGKFHQYTGGGKLINGYAMLQDTIKPSPELVDSIYTCSMCGACDIACKTNLGDLIEPLDSLYAIREHLVATDSLPPSLRAVLRNLQHTGNPDGHPAAARAAWADAHALRRLDDGRATVLLHVGNAAFDRAHWPALRHAADALLAAGVDAAIGGQAEPDCGALAFAIGERALATRLAQETAAWVQRSGACQLITCSDEALAAFRGIYPRLGVSLGAVEVLHISEWLAALAQPARSARPAEGELVTYHDSCHLGRLSEPWEGDDFGPWNMVFNSIPARKPETAVRFGLGGVYEAPRALLAASGARVVEMERNREFAYCCGAGAGAELANPAFSQFAGRERLEEALATGAGTLVTSCHGCTSHLNKVARRAGMPIRVVNLADYLAGARQDTAATTVTE